MSSLPNRKTTRAKWHAYNGAEYFVTICTKGRGHYFGQITDSVMNLTAIGEYLKMQIEKTETIRGGDVSIPLYCIMPNHIHLIVVINPSRDALNASAETALNASAETALNASAETALNASAETALNASAEPASNASESIADARGASLQHCQFGAQSNNLGSVIRGIKSAVTKFANDNGIVFGWQSRYHDHIIRNQQEMNNIADYVESNPLCWQSDCFYSI